MYATRSNVPDTIATDAAQGSMMWDREPVTAKVIMSLGTTRGIQTTFAAATSGLTKGRYENDADDPRH